MFALEIVLLELSVASASQPFELRFANGKGQKERARILARLYA